MHGNELQNIFIKSEAKCLTMIHLMKLNKKKIGRKLDLKSTLTQNPNNNTENG